MHSHVHLHTTIRDLCTCVHAWARMDATVSYQHYGGQRAPYGKYAIPREGSKFVLRIPTWGLKHVNNVYFDLVASPGNGAR